MSVKNTHFLECLEVPASFVVWQVLSGVSQWFWATVGEQILKRGQPVQAPWWFQQLQEQGNQGWDWKQVGCALHKIKSLVAVPAA